MSLPTSLSLCLCAMLMAAVGAVHADGMIPETSVVIVNEADGEASITVRNDDPFPALLLVTLQNVPEDEEPLLFLTQPVWRVEAGQEQRVRFLLRSGVPLQTQRLKRVVFEGVRQQPGVSNEVARVGVSVRQNLPVIIHPKGLARHRPPGRACSGALVQRRYRSKTPRPTWYAWPRKSG